MENNNYDIAVIGLGPAGLEIVNCAIKNNLNVIAFEKNEVGGCCLNVGCIPTKSMLHFASFIKESEDIKNLGFHIDDFHFSLSEILKHKNNIVSKFNKAIENTISKKIKLVKKEAKIVIENNIAKVACEDKTINAKYVIWAAGSKPKELSGLEFDHNLILDSNDIFNLEKIPKKLLIIGSGAIGLENAYIFSKLGTKVTIIEKEKNLAPVFDIDIQKRLERILKLEGINFYKDDFVREIKNNTAILNSNTEIEFDKMLVAIGRRPNSINIQAKNLFKIGDANTSIMLAHSAVQQAKDIMNKILYNKSLPTCEIPKVIYITPEIASIGVNENEIKDKQNYEIKKIMIGSNPKAWCDLSTDGFIKVILKDNIVAGFHIVSKNASELISIASIFMQQKMKREEILNLVFPHPSLSESIIEVLK